MFFSLALLLPRVRRASCWSSPPAPRRARAPAASTPHAQKVASRNLGTLTAAAGPSPCDPYRQALPMRPSLKARTFSFLNYCASTDDRRTNDATCGPQEWVADWITALGGNPERTLTAAAGPSPRDPYRHSLAMRPPRKARPFCFLNYIFWLYVKKRTKRHVFCDSARSPHRTTKPSRGRLRVVGLKAHTPFAACK